MIPMQQRVVHIKICMMMVKETKFRYKKNKIQMKENPEKNTITENTI